MPVRTKDQLKAELSTTFFENPGGGITPALVQTFMIDVIDSIPDAAAPNMAFGAGAAAGSGLAAATGLGLFKAGGTAAGIGSAAGVSTFLVFTADFLSITSLPAEFSLSRATTGTYFDTSGVLQTAAIDASRFDHNLSTLAAKGVLIEEQRTNQLKDSNNMGSANWFISSATFTPNTAVSPDGTTNAGTLSIGGLGFVGQNTAVSSGQQITCSVYVKQAPSGSALAIRLTTADAGVGFDTGTSTKITLTSTWQRLATGFTAPSNTTLRYQLGSGDVSNNVDSDCVGNVLVCFGEAEVGPFATSYIPATTAAVTRSADLPSANSPLDGYLTSGPSVWEFQDEATGTVARTAYAAGAFDWPINKWYRSMGVYAAGADTSGHMTVGSPY